MRFGFITTTSVFCTELTLWHFWTLSCLWLALLGFRRVHWFLCCGHPATISRSEVLKIVCLEWKPASIGKLQYSMKSDKEERDHWSLWMKIIWRCFRRAKGCKDMLVFVKTEFCDSALVNPGSFWLLLPVYSFLDSLVLSYICFHRGRWLKEDWNLVVGPNPQDNQRLQRLLKILLNQNI